MAEIPAPRIKFGAGLGREDIQVGDCAREIPGQARDDRQEEAGMTGRGAMRSRGKPGMTAKNYSLK